MRNPFKNQEIGRYAIKKNYNQIRSRTNSLQSNKSNHIHVQEDPYKQNKLTQIRLGLQYKSNIAQKKHLEREALKTYGPESLRFQPTYFQKIEKIRTENINYYDMGLGNQFVSKNIRNSQQRDSDAASTLINFGNSNGLMNANSYQSNIDCVSKRSLSINSGKKQRSYFGNQRTNIKKSSINYGLMQGHNFCQTSQTEQQEPSKRFQSNSNRVHNTYGFNTIDQGSYEDKSSNHLLRSSKNLLESQKTLTTSSKALKSAKALNSAKSIKSSLRLNQNWVAQQRFSKNKSPQRIKVKGKQFYASPYYQI